MVSQELRRDPNDAMTPSPTEAVQCKFLLTVFAVFNGDIPAVVAANESMGMWATVCILELHKDIYLLTAIGVSLTKIAFGPSQYRGGLVLGSLDGERNVEKVRI